MSDQQGHIFINYSRQDTAQAERIQQHLEQSGYVCWRDISEIVGGAAWVPLIDMALENAALVISLVSENSIESKWVERELHRADELNKTIIPVRLDTARIPLMLLTWHPIDCQANCFDSGLEQLMHAVRHYLVRPEPPPSSASVIATLPPESESPSPQNPAPAIATVSPKIEGLLRELDDANTSHKRRAKIGDGLNKLGDPRPGVGLRPEGLPDIAWVQVPGSKVTLEDNAGTFDVNPFYLARYPVTHSQYQAFVDDPNGYVNSCWWADLDHPKEPKEARWPYANHPCERVNWYEALAFCRWLSERLSYDITLPTEQQWQLAASAGQPDFEYPWGKYWGDDCTNTRESDLKRTTAVGLYPSGQARFGDEGIDDLAGNVWEWCLNQYDNPNVITPNRSGKGCVVRGGSWRVIRSNARATYRLKLSPDHRNHDLGFRLCCVTPILNTDH